MVPKAGFEPVRSHNTHCADTVIHGDSLVIILAIGVIFKKGQLTCYSFGTQHGGVMPLDLIKDIFDPVVEKIKQKIESLRNIKPFKGVGIEGWFKVEIVAALGNKVKSIKNSGPDLELEDGTKIEIKAATDFNKNYFFDPIQKYNAPCLFLADGSNPKKLTDNLRDDVELVYEVINDPKEGSKGDWLIGLVKPKRPRT
jgi:hypothetical protein